MNKITEFVEDFIPKNLSKKQKEKLKEELICHILDKKDYYVDLGYGEEESIEKAIEDFCVDEKDKDYINSEFENLYSERNWFGVIVFFAIASINMLCLLSGLWVVTADVKGEPEPVSVIIGFGFIFLILLIVAITRIKMYRKSLVAAGIINILIPASMICCVYPQNAAYAIVYNLIYLIDILTPFSTRDIISDYNDWLLFYALLFAIPLAIALYCFVSAIRIKKGRAKSVKKPKIKLVVFSCVFLTVAVASGLLYGVSEEYIDNYPIWFNKHCNFISEEAEESFEEIAIGDSYADAQDYLRSKGFVSVEECKKFSDRITLKQFNHELGNYDFYDGFEVWYMPDDLHKGSYDDESNGFVGLMSSGDKVTGICIGEIQKDLYRERDLVYGKSDCFGYRERSFRHNISDAINIFRALRKGESEEIVLNRFTEDYGVVYGKSFCVENGTEKHIYRIYTCNGEGESGSPPQVIATKYAYFELVFENGKLSYGTMYYDVDNPDTDVVIESVK